MKLMSHVSIPRLYPLPLSSPLTLMLLPLGLPQLCWWASHKIKRCVGMTFHSFTAFLMSEINPWLPGKWRCVWPCTSGWLAGQSDAEFEKHTHLGRCCMNPHTGNHEIDGAEWSTRRIKLKTIILDLSPLTRPRFHRNQKPFSNC